ncbi:MAG: BlaI/MecI/CopY family transcriptional regulator [Isosphaeraceae bacterium]|nr:BlaI/MecI/CopY family transcriptional regulator [Isosphaeraceae bacterium]
MEVLKALWDAGPGTVRQINEVLDRRGKRWAYTTVLTLLQRLQAKGCVRSEPSGVAHVYHATATRDELIQDRLQDLADRLCGGAPAPLVLALVQGHRYSAEEIARFRKLLDELEGEGSPADSGRKGKGR